MRSLGVLLALLCLVTACGSGTHQSAIRVTLTAQNHHPRASESPYKQWWYCVRVRTAAGKSVASRIHLQILSDRTRVQGVGLVSLKRGYDHWCADIGGEANVLAAAPRGKRLVFQAVVRAKGVTVERSWPIVVQQPLLSASGIGGVPFGLAKPGAVQELSTLFGRPSRRFTSDACGPNFTEVEWGHLYAEFRRGRFSGYRYMTGAWLRRGVVPGSDRLQLRTMPATAKQITLGSTLQQLRERYGKLTLVGTDRWQSRDGLVFYISFATRQPPPPSGRITEIKYGTCGDF